MNKLLQNLPAGKIVVALFAMFWIGGPLLAFVFPEARPFMFKEDGFIEEATPLLYMVAAALFLVAPYDLPRRKWMLAVVCLLFAAREYDIHELVSERGFLFFPDNFKDTQPFNYAVVETIAVTSIAIFVAATLLSYARITWTNLKNRDLHQYIVITGWMCVIVAVLTDGFKSKYFDLVGHLPPVWARYAVEAIEETAEFMIPVCFLVGLLEYYRTRRANRGSAGN